ncbi:MAG: SDR family NAD(P)-dependent oxidoreductase, partial [Burkholderiales bacterium]
MTQTPFTPVARLDGKVAVIAGGLGAIGHASAERLAALGASCVLLARRADSDGRAAALPTAGEQRHTALIVDIVDTPSLQAAAAKVRADYGRCDILINSAGHTQPVAASDLDALTDALIDEVVTSNFRGVFATIRA